MSKLEEVVDHIVQSDKCGTPYMHCYDNCINIDGELTFEEIIKLAEAIKEDKS